MPKAVYILIIIFCTQFFAVSQSSDVDDLLNQAMELVEENPEKSISLTKKAFKKAQRDRDNYGMVSAKNVMGYIGMMTNDYEASYINYSDALEYLEKSGSVDLLNKVSILNNLAIIKSSYDDHASAASLYKLAHQTAVQYIDEVRTEAEASGDPSLLDDLPVSLLIDLPYEMAFELKNSGQYLKAGEVLVDLWELSEFKNDTVLLARVVNELGTIKKRNKEYAKAQDFFSIAAFNENVDSEIRAIALHNLAATYLDQEDYSKAEKYFAQALELNQINDDDFSQFVTLLDQGELAYKLDNVPAAIEKWETALSIYDDIKNDPELFVIYDWLQKAYLNSDVSKAAVYGNLYTSNIRNWMTVQSNQKENPTLQAFNTRIDTILADRSNRLERMALLKRYWPLGVVALLIIMLFVYMVQVSLNKRREQILERNLKADRASVADEILNKIRRD